MIESSRLVIRHSWEELPLDAPEVRLSIQALGSRVHAGRVEQELSIEQLAEQVFIDEETLENLESGRKVVRISTNAAWRLARVAGLSPGSVVKSAGYHAIKTKVSLDI